MVNDALAERKRAICLASPNYARLHPMLSGVLAINKPRGITSHDVVAQVRRVLREGSAAALKATTADSSVNVLATFKDASMKVGHTGTLDPFATGVLVVAIGSATRLIRFSHTWDKSYEATALVGATSDTDDLTGEVTRHHPNPPQPDNTTLRALEKQFTGTQQQLPPRYAAIKVAGKKLYEYARQKKEVPRSSRTITIHSLHLDATYWPELHLTVRCGTGTYIRALARDVGDALGYGAHLTKLTRTAVGPFAATDAATLADVTPTTLERLLKPPKQLVDTLPQTMVTAEEATHLRHGKEIQVATLTDAPEIAAALDDGSLVAIVTPRQPGSVRPLVVLPTGEN